MLRDKQMPIAIFADWMHQVALYSVVHFLPGMTGGFVGSYDMGWAEESTGNHLAGLWISVVLPALGAAAATSLRFSPEDERGNES
ncbi:hypothetical protein [Kitasatospora sp. NPDC057738]|uniref:hypothetical protein n=1 Tax=Kitasatospora sp. NPDC057738 TaxID=3346233 RepID=UPI00369D1350